MFRYKKYLFLQNLKVYVYENFILMCELSELIYFKTYGYILVLTIFCFPFVFQGNGPHKYYVFRVVFIFFTICHLWSYGKSLVGASS